MVTPSKAKMAWYELYGAMKGLELKRGAPDSEDQRGLLPLEKVSGQTYTLAKKLIALGVEVEIPAEVLAVCEPKPVATAVAEPVEAVRDNIGQVLYKGGAKIGDGIKGLFKKIIGENEAKAEG